MSILSSQLSADKKSDQVKKYQNCCNQEEEGECV